MPAVMYIKQGWLLRAAFAIMPVRCPAVPF